MQALTYQKLTFRNGADLNLFSNELYGHVYVKKHVT